MGDYFYADPHFGNEMILIYCNRPWRNATHMDSGLIKIYNSIITDSDTVYIIGDLTLKTARHRGYIQGIVEKLNGRKILILGNHDDLKPFVYEKLGFHSVHTQLDYRSGDFEATLVHDPKRAKEDRSRLYLCGHVHDDYLTTKNIINVGVDIHEYKPISLETVMEISETMGFLGKG